MGRERLSIEFGRYSQWLAEAIAAVDPPERVGVACRGTGNPALFESMARAIDAAPGRRVLDVGCGIGGPGAWLQRSTGAMVVGVDVMEPSVRALRFLFPDQLATVASSRRLPFRDSAFSGAWALGVVETISDKSSALSEIRRVLVPRGRLAIYSYVCGPRPVPVSPRADRFESAAQIVETLGATGFAVVEADRSTVGDAPQEWKRARREVRIELERSRGATATFNLVRQELRVFARLEAAGEIEPWMFVAEREVA